VWLHDHEKEKWVQATFRHQELINAPWTQYLWDIATGEHLERGGRKDDDMAIAQALAELLDRAGRGPDQAQAAAVPDGWGPAALPAAQPAVFDPYAGDAPPPGNGVMDELELTDAGMYGLPGPADLTRRVVGSDPLFLSPARTGAGESPEAVAAFKARYFDDLPPLETDPPAAPAQTSRDVAVDEELFGFLEED
jgi:hypothetical protein